MDSSNRLTEKLQELEEEAKTMYKLDIKNLYIDLDAYYQEDGARLDERQKLFLMLAFNHCTQQTAANICGYKKKKSVTEECSKKLFKYLKKLLQVDKITWGTIYILIKEDNGYMDT